MLTSVQAATRAPIVEPASEISSDIHTADIHTASIHTASIETSTIVKASAWYIHTSAATSCRIETTLIKTATRIETNTDARADISTEPCAHAAT